VRISSRLLLAACLLIGAMSAQVCAADAAVPADEPLESVVILQVDGWIDLGPDGAITRFETETTLTPALRENLERTVLTWRAEPVVIDGKPTQVRAKTRVVLAATRLGDTYSVKVDNVSFPRGLEVDVGRPIAGTVPRITGNHLGSIIYPARLERAGVSGRTLLCIRVGADGRAEEIVAIQSMLYNVQGQERNIRKAIALIEQAAVSGAKAWRFNIPVERGRMAADARTVRVPVEYLMRNVPTLDKPGAWRNVVRVPIRKVDWLPESADSQRVGVSDVAAGELMSADSVVKLDTSVVGTVVM